MYIKVQIEFKNKFVQNPNYLIPKTRRFVLNREGAIKATRQGAIAGVFVCTITIFFFIIGYLGNSSEGILGYYNDPWIFIDIVLVLLLTFGIYKRSRAASIVMVVLYLLTPVIFYFEGYSLGAMRGITSTILALIILWFFLKAAHVL